MSSLNSPALVQHIQQLLQQRQQHANAIVAIDSTLARVNSALGAKIASARVGRPPSVKGPAAAGAGPKRRRRRSKFSVSANDSVLAFVKANKNPTTQEIEKHWKSEGRGATAANTLSQLSKQKKLKRVALGAGIRGSRYSIP